ncbi:unnamed protein product [Oikopleura dioica]|uniref:Uncharacterized protein n=1 Tax=Oikopleura dioica TaxID=34765 RepID=E4YPR8_OIKDI|nr:unnamed protein product [Oikopleura dioica]
MKLFIASIIAATFGEEFFKYPKPEKFVEWAESAIEIIEENNSADENYQGIMLRNLGNVVYDEVTAAKGIRIGKAWKIQAIYVNPETKHRFFCILKKTTSNKRPEIEEMNAQCEQYRF